MRVALDLFSGSGAATAAFQGAAGWHVITLDSDRGRRPAILGDVGRLPLRGRVDFLWASPPCTEFSDARPGSLTRRPSLKLVFAALQAVCELRPRFWILENVRGAIPFLGIPAQKVGPFCLWGYFPPIRLSLELHQYRKDTKRVRSAAARAAVPRALSEAVFQAVTRYWDFPRLLDLRELRKHRHVRRRTDGAGAPLFEALR